MSHIFGFGEACLGNTLGFTTYLSDPMSALAKLPDVKPDVFMSVPSLWESSRIAAMTETHPEKRAAALASATGGHLKFCLSGGAGLKPRVKELFHECGLLHHRGLRTHRVFADAHAQSPRRVPLRHRRKAAPECAADAWQKTARSSQRVRAFSPATTRIRPRRGKRSLRTDGSRPRHRPLHRRRLSQIVDRKKDILVHERGKEHRAREHRAEIPRRTRSSSSSSSMAMRRSTLVGRRVDQRCDGRSASEERRAHGSRAKKRSRRWCRSASSA